VLLVVALAAWLADTAVSMNDETDPRPALEMMRTVLLDTGFGRIWAAQLALAVLLLAGVLAGISERIVMVLAAAALASQAWIGHAAIGSGLGGALWLGMMAIHLLAAGAWLGGLLPLGTLLLAAQRARRGPLVAAAHTALRRFSRMGHVAVSLLLLSGFANLYFLVVAPGGLTARSYGLVLTAKLCLVVVLISIALANRFELVPRLGGQEQVDLATLAALRRNVAIEQSLGLLVLVVVSALGILPPAAS
jgi:putative copper resistance protein D